MADLPSTLAGLMQVEETKFKAAVAEFLMTKIGKNLNYLLSAFANRIQLVTSLGTNDFDITQSNVLLIGCGGGGAGAGSAGSNGGIPTAVGGGGGGAGSPILLKPAVGLDITLDFATRIGLGGIKGTAVGTGGTGNPGGSGGFSALSQYETVLISHASPAVLTVANTAGLVPGMEIFFETNGTLPAGVSPDVIYYVSTIINSSTFKISATHGGAELNTTTNGSGTHTLHRCIAVWHGASGGLGGAAGVAGAGGQGETNKGGVQIGPSGGDGGAGTSGTSEDGESDLFPGGVNDHSNVSTRGGAGGAGFGPGGQCGRGGDLGGSGSSAPAAASASYGAGGGGGGGAGQYTGGPSNTGGDGADGIQGALIVVQL